MLNEKALAREKGIPARMPSVALSAGNILPQLLIQFLGAQRFVGRLTAQRTGKATLLN
jgi:hypothetical protein